MKARKNHKAGDRSGRSFDSFLDEEGIREEVEAVAIKRVLAWELERAMREQGDLRLAYAEDFGDGGLGHAAVLEEGVDLQGELGLEQFLFGMGQAEVGEDVAGAFGTAGRRRRFFLDLVFMFYCDSSRFRFRLADGFWSTVHQNTNIHIRVYRRVRAGA
jgi:hypothetical protein